MDAKVYELAKRARELLVAEYTELGIEPQAARLMAQGHQPGGVHYAAVKAIIAAMATPEGCVLIKADTLADLANDAEALIVQTEFRRDRIDGKLASVREARAMLAERPEAGQ
jgi:hypothetical protein